MGIPSYYKNIVDEFPDTIHSQLSHNQINDRVFLDFNCAIHQCSNNIKKNYNINDHTIFEKKLIEETLEYINKIYNFTKPTTLFYISIDGVPSRSKIIQQRNRRFNGMWKKNKTLEILCNMKPSQLINDYYNKTINEWSSDNISPGTNFMNNLSDAIKNFIKKFSVLSILSDSNEEGEGEYKIVKYIKENVSIETVYTDIIYGLDADLIMLSLINNKTLIYLLREPVFFDTNNTEEFLYFNIKLLEEKIIKSLKMNYNIQGETDEIIIYSYVFICSLLGNDFIPHLSYIDIKNDGINILLNKYAELYTKFKTHIIYFENNKWKINNDILLKFIKRLSINEDTLFNEYDNSYYSYSFANCQRHKNKIYYSSAKNPEILNAMANLSKTIDNIINNDVEKFSDVIKPSENKWRQRYYYYLFNDNNGSNISNICLNYYEALQWILDYYYNQEYNTTWYYRFNYSPTIIDLSNYLEIMFTQNETVLKKKMYDIKLYPKINISTDLQLLMILPITSIYIIDKKYQNILTEVNNGFTHYYPFYTIFDNYLKNFSWQFIPKLPEFDIIELDNILQYYDSL
jgi:5'-3' exoribonuclease 2